MLGVQLPGGVDGLCADRLAHRHAVARAQHGAAAGGAVDGRLHVQQRILRRDGRVVVQREPHAARLGSAGGHPRVGALAEELAQHLAVVVDVCGEERDGHAQRVGPAHLLLGDRPAVLHTQTEFGARVLALHRLVHVEYGLDGDIAVHVAGDLPALAHVPAAQRQQLLGRVVGAAAVAVRHADDVGGVPAVVGEAGGDVADPGRAVRPDLHAHGTEERVGLVAVRDSLADARDLVGPHPHGRGALGEELAHRLLRGGAEGQVARHRHARRRRDLQRRLQPRAELAVGHLRPRAHDDAGGRVFAALACGLPVLVAHVHRAGRIGRVAGDAQALHGGVVGPGCVA